MKFKIFGWQFIFTVFVQKNPELRRWCLRGEPSVCTSSYVHKPIIGPQLAMDELVEVIEVRK